MEDRGGEVLFDDGLTCLYYGDAMEIIPSLGEIFDAVIFDPPRFGPVTMTAIDLANAFVPYVDGWIVHLAGGKQWDCWNMPNIPYRVPPVLNPSYSENDYIVFIHPSGFTQGELKAPLLREDIEPYTPPQWCHVARHPELYRWLYSFVIPAKDPVILDPCCGSGNSLIEARKMGIRSVGIEWKGHRARQIQRLLNELG